MSRIIRLMATLGVAAAVLGSASAANAVIAAVSTSPEDYTVDTFAFNTNVVCTFDAPCVAPFTVTPAGGTVLKTNTASNGAAPPGDPTTYLSVVGGGTATLFAGGNYISDLSFFMGSPDTYNSISFYNGVTLLQTITGANFNGATPNGDQSVAQRISFTGLNGAGVTSVVFGSTENSFEIDRISAVATVPEPATWGMMILGFGLVGVGLRLRRRRMAQAIG